MIGAHPEMVDVGPGATPISEILVHDPKSPYSSYAFMLAEMGMSGEGLPVPFGILRSTEEHVYRPHEGQATPDGFAKIMRGSGAWVHEKDGSVHPYTE